MRLTKKHIMIVDDDPEVLKSLARFLSKRGYRVSPTSGGKEALEQMERDFANNDLPDLVLLDALMPDMDGVETLEEMRKKFPNVDVVMISALKNDSVARATLKMGAYEWLPKPFSLEHLEATIFVTLMRKGFREESDSISNP